MSDRKLVQCYAKPYLHTHKRCCFCTCRPKVPVRFERHGMWHTSCVMCLRHLFRYPHVHLLRRFYQ